MKTKRIVASLLALMLAVSVITISAYAEGDEGIEPYGPVVSCPRCGNGAAELLSSWKETTLTPVSGCNSLVTPHNHDITREYNKYDCRSCGIYTISYVVGNICRR